MRSVEAATRDDAIAAAREQFGPHARVVGVRRVRSGGVLGFFATERYVAEVADQFARPGVPTPSAGPAPAAPVSSFESPLASAAPARARATAPARNGAAAWAAEAARSGDAHRGPVTGARAAAPAPSTPAGPTPASSTPASSTTAGSASLAEDERLDELAGLLGGLPSATPRSTAAPRAAFTPAPSAPSSPARPAGSSAAPKASFSSSRPAPAAAFPDVAAPAGTARATFPRATATKATRPAATPAPSEEETPVLLSPFAAALEASGAPSPFTAALARMVAGDRDVEQAVAQAMEEPALPDLAPPVGKPARAAKEPAAPARQQDPVQVPDTPAPRPSLAAAIRSADSSKRSKAVHQEETTVGEQVVTAPSTSTPATAPVRAAEDEAPAPAVSTREEEIAEALRAALAQGHSDEALAGILRKMLAGDSPKEALAEPTAAPAVPAPAVAEPVVEPVPAVMEATVVEAAVEPVPAVAGPVAEPVAEAVAEPVVEAAVEPAAETAQTAQTVEAPRPTVEPALTWDLGTSANYSLFGLPAPTSGSSGLGWDVPAPAATCTPLWGEPVPEPSPAPAVSDAPIWAEVVRRDPAPSTGAGTEPAAVEEPAAAEAEDLFQEPAAAEETTPATVEATATEEVATEDAAVEAEAAEAAAPADGAELTGADELAPLLARTASDPAPMTMSMDATTVMPRVSLLPGLAGSRGRGLPPVPPSSSRPAVPPARPRPERPAAPSQDEATDRDADRAPARTRETAAPRALATVTRLPVAPLMAGPDLPDMPELDEPEDAAETTRAVSGTVSRLTALGVPEALLGEDFDDAVAADGTYAALTRALARNLPQLPQVPSGAGEVLFVVGPGMETLRAAQSLAATLRLDPDRVQWATRGDLAGLAPRSSRVTTTDTAVERHQEATASGSLTIVAVDAPLRSDPYWMAQMLGIWSPAAVWAVVEATRKPEDVEVWLDGLARVDALVVQDTDLSADPAAVLRRLTTPVALLDGVRATPHRWASLLCERLESPQA
ncbi:hypothetical protein [Blastococcus sp. TF02A-35]|uniref:hypothetical protein n=1 Tax=Blastococcus sp. TF02A-35 TaxID=2559612 RepID=UPI00143183E8|nr:hypothetical protein [Blastococcus sp. TF02A_35]